jgi:hypothetical protein
MLAGAAACRRADALAKAPPGGAPDAVLAEENLWLKRHRRPVHARRVAAALGDDVVLRGARREGCARGWVRPTHASPPCRGNAAPRARLCPTAEQGRAAAPAASGSARRRRRGDAAHLAVARRDAAPHCQAPRARLRALDRQRVVERRLRSAERARPRARTRPRARARFARRRRTRRATAPNADDRRASSRSLRGPSRTSTSPGSVAPQRDACLSVSSRLGSSCTMSAEKRVLIRFRCVTGAGTVFLDAKNDLVKRADSARSVSSRMWSGCTRFRVGFCGVSGFLRPPFSSCKRNACRKHARVRQRLLWSCYIITALIQTTHPPDHGDLKSKRARAT